MREFTFFILPMAQSVVLVTGGNGLVGRGIESHLKSGGKAENETWIFLSSKDGDLRFFHSFQSLISRDYEQTKAIFEKHKPTHVIHLAALVGGLFKNMRQK